MRRGLFPLVFGLCLVSAASGPGLAGEEMDASACGGVLPLLGGQPRDLLAIASLITPACLREVEERQAPPSLLRPIDEGASALSFAAVHRGAPWRAHGGPDGQALDRLHFAIGLLCAFHPRWAREQMIRALSLRADELLDMRSEGMCLVGASELGDPMADAAVDSHLAYERNHHERVPPVVLDALRHNRASARFRARLFPLLARARERPMEGADALRAELCAPSAELTAVHPACSVPVKTPPKPHREYAGFRSWRALLGVELAASISLGLGYATRDSSWGRGLATAGGALTVGTIAGVGYGLVRDRTYRSESPFGLLFESWLVSIPFAVLGGVVGYELSEEPGSRRFAVTAASWFVPIIPLTTFRW